MLEVNNLIGFGVAGNLASPALVYQANPLSANNPGHTITFLAQPIGAADDDERAIFVGLMGVGVGPDIVSLTIGGVSAQRVAKAVSLPNLIREFWAARVPKSVGTTADIVITNDPGGAFGFVSYITAAIWSATGIDSLEATDTSESDVGNLNIDVRSSGFALCIDFNDGGGASVWTNATERFNANIPGNGTSRSGADYKATAEEINRNITVVHAGTEYSLAASFR